MSFQETTANSGYQMVLIQDVMLNVDPHIVAKCHYLCNLSVCKLCYQTAA